MTTPWQPGGEWAGQRVAVVSPVADVSAIDADRVIVVNDASLLLPGADMLVALDGNWPAAWRAFAGARVTGVADPDLDALYIGHRPERVKVGGAQLEITNSGLTAIRVAAAMGAREITLHGFRPHEAQPAEFYIGVAEGLEAIIAESTARGIPVTHAQEPARRRRTRTEDQECP